MRRARVTYQGAFHHAMNRGLEGRTIFQKNTLKNFFLELINKLQNLYRIRILAYCIMDNHYHLVMQNTSQKLSEFFKQLNGQFGQQYRKLHGGKGSVFQGRFKSMLIQDEKYLLMTLAYVLNNPVKEGLCNTFADYPWSSGGVYFSNNDSNSIDSEYVEELIGSEEQLAHLVGRFDLDRLPIVRSNMGKFIGSKNHLNQVMRKSNRRSGRFSQQHRRQNDRYFEPLEKVLFEFERKNDIKMEEIDPRSKLGKRFRGELLVYLKERAGMKYKDIAELDLYSNLSINSLGPLYHRNKDRKF